jgi:hypothetical protein
MFLTLVPAYGRDYKNGKEVQADWDAGKDFIINNAFSPDDGRYINKQDAKPGMTLNIRYKRLMNIKQIKVK